MHKSLIPFCVIRVDAYLLTYFNAIDCDVDCVKAYCSWSPVGTVGSISVGTYQHILTGSA